MKKKIELYNKEIIRCFLDNENDPLNKLILNEQDMTDIYEKYPQENKKIFYFNRKKILYDLDTKFTFDKKDLDNINSSVNLSELFYLSLLLSFTKENAINYDYPFEYCSIIYNYTEKNNLSHIQKIIMSKIVMDLYDYYECILDEDEDNSEDINKYKKEINENKKKSKNMIEYRLEELEKENLKIDFEYDKKNIEYFYAQIIISLIKGNKFNDYEYCYDIINQLDLENIYITENIYKELSKFFNNQNNQNDYINKYTIDKNDDCLDEVKINFYYILFKYILKSTIYIFGIKFLFNNYKNFYKKIKILNNPENQNNEKILEIIGVFQNFNNNYNINQSINENINKNINHLDKSDFFNNKSYDEARKKIKEVPESEESNINNENNEEDNMELKLGDKISQNKANQILNKLKFKLKITKELGGISSKFEDIKYGENNYQIDHIDTITKIDNEYLKGDNNKENDIYDNYQKLLIFFEEIQDYLIRSKIKISSAEIDMELTKKKNNNIICKSTFVNKYNKNKRLIFIDENILEDNINTKSKGFIYLINELNNDDYEIAEKNTN